MCAIFVSDRPHWAGWAAWQPLPRAAEGFCGKGGRRTALRYGRIFLNGGEVAAGGAVRYTVRPFERERPGLSAG